MFKRFILLTALVTNILAFEITDYTASVDNTYIFGVKNGDFEDKIGFITHERIIVCDPEITGAFEYLNLNQIAFYPNKPFSKGTKYTCGNKNGKISFITNPFGVENVRILDDKNYMLSLNDETIIDELRPKLKVYTQEKLAKNSVSFKLKSSDNKNFLITLDKSYENLYLFLPNGLKSKANASLESDFVQDISSGNVFFKDSTSAVNLKEPKLIPYAFEDGVLGFKIKLKEYIKPDKKFIQIPDIKSFSLSDISYSYEESDPDYYYEFDVKSNQFLPNTEYQIKILRGFGDTYTVNREPRNYVIKMPDLKPFAKFSDELPYISKGSSIAFKSANLNSVKVVIDQVSEQNFRYFLNYNSDISKLTKEIASKNFDLNNSLNEITEHRLEFDFSGFKDGVYNITLYYKDDKNEMKQIARQAYFSDISALATVGDSGIFVFTSRLSTAKALPNTQITIYNENNEILANGVSDESGVYRFGDKNLLSKNLKSIHIKNQNEESFLILTNPINDDATSEGNSTNYEVLTYLATDIIRPNEILEGIIVLKDYSFKPLANLPIKIKILDPLYKTIKNFSETTDEFGTVKINEPMGDLTGVYSINVEFENKLLDSKRFSVESFIPQRIKSEILTTKDDFLKGENINVNLVSTYLFGAPAANLTGGVVINLSSKEPKIPNYEDFSFSNSLIQNETILDTKYYDILLNNEGKKSLIFEYNKDLEVSNAINANINFSILDNTKTVSEYKNLTIYPHKTITGIKGSKDFADSGDSVKFRVLSLDSLSKKELSPKLNISIYSVSWNYVLDSRTYKEQKELNLVDSFELSKSEFEYKFNNGGDYVVVANDYLNGSSASYRVYVSGWGGMGIKSAKDIQKAQITLDKEKYKASESIKVELSSAIKEGTAIISLVDGKVLDFKVVNFDNFKALAEFNLPKEFTKGHINAVITRSAQPLPTPLRTYANMAVKVDKSQHKANLTLQVQEKAKNNDFVDIKIKSEPNSLVALFVVDEGVLQIINQKELDAFKYFDTTTGINVVNYDIYDLLSTYVSSAKVLSFGGDAMFEAASKRDLNPVKAKDLKTFKIAKYLKTDENGEAKFEFKTPNNFNSKLRVVAMVLKDDRISSANSYIDVKDDIIIKPGVVVYLTKDDKLNLPITVINTTDSNKTLNLQSEMSQNLAIHLNKKTLNLAPLQSAQVDGFIYALELGAADFNISITDDNNNSYLHTTNLDIISPYPASTYSKSGFMRSFLDFNITDESYKTAYIGTSATPDSLLKNMGKKLIEYPYGCTEQISSRLLAMANLYTVDDREKKEVENMIEVGVSNLLLRLKDNGSFGFWSKFSDTNILASIYASDVLLELDSSRNLIGKGQKELIYSYLKMPHQDPFHAMYAAYILSENKALEEAKINYLFDNKVYEYNLVTLYMMAAILEKNFFERELSYVLSQIQNYNLDDTKFDGYTANFDSTVRNLAFALYLHAKHFPTNDFSQKLADRLSSNLDTVNSTQKTAFVLRAFKNYFKTALKTPAHEILSNAVSTKYDKASNIELNLDENRNFRLATTGPLYYSIMSFGNEKLEPKHFAPVINDNYFSSNDRVNIYRDFIDIEGNKLNLNELKLNQTIFSRVKIYSNRSYVPNVVVNEQISPCFELINERIYGYQRSATTTDNITFENQDIKDERVVSFISSLNTEQVFYTPFKVVMSGSCVLPAIKVEFMQNEAVWDYDLEMEKFEVKK